MAFGSTQNSKVIGVFCLNTSPTSSPTLEHLEVCSSSMKSNIPIPLMKQNPNSTGQKTNFDALIPNLSMVISEFEVTVSYEKLSWSSSLSNVRISHNKVENKSEITTDEIAISDDKGKDINDQVPLVHRIGSGNPKSYLFLAKKLDKGWFISLTTGGAGVAAISI